MKRKILISLLVSISMMAMMLPQWVLAEDNWSVSAFGIDYDTAGNVDAYTSTGIYGVVEGSNASYTFYLPASGNYKITTLSTDLNGDEWVSPVKMTVNGEVVAPNKISGSTTGVTSEVYLNLDAGENTVKYELNGPKGVDASQYLMYIDEVTVEYIPAIEDPASFFVEGENMIGGGTVVNGSYNEGSMLSLWGLFGTVTLTYNITLNEASDYILSEFVALALYSYTAPWTLSVNGTDYFVRGITADTGVSSAGAYNNIGVEKVTTDIVVPFVEGTNTVKIVVSSASNGINTMIDYLKFTKVEKTESLYAEAFGLVTNKPVNNITNDPYSYSYTFDIPEDMNVNLKFNGMANTGANDPSKYYCGLKIKVGNNDAFEVTTETMNYSNVAADGVADYTTKVPIALTAGDCTITFIGDTPNTLGDNPWAHLRVNWFELIPVDSAITTVELAADSEMIKEGETLTFTADVRDRYDLFVSDSKINSIVWAIDNENIAEISAEGVLTAYNPGVVTATVTVTGTDGTEKSASMPITIYGEGGLIIIGKGVEDGTAIVKFTKAPAASAETLEAFDVIFGTFETSSGIPKTLKNVDIKEDVTAREGRVTTVKADGMTAEQVNVYVWDSVSEMNPLAAATALK